MTDAELIREAVQLSGLSARVYAELVLVERDERSVRRWSSGDNPLPRRLRPWLRWYVALTPDQRDRLTDALTQHAVLVCADEQGGED